MERPRSAVSDRSHFAIPRKPLNPDQSTPRKAALYQPLQATQDADDDPPMLSEVKDTNRKEHISKGRFNGFWILEVLSLALAFLALAAIVILLAIFQGQPLPQWPHDITINAFIAIFTTTLKAALMVPLAEGISQLKWLWYSKPRALIDLQDLDNASRGPVGSFFLLLKRRKHYLATFGAFITIVALAVDPISQQIVQYHSCLQPETGNVALISRTNNYTQTGQHIGAADNTLDGPMQLAMYNGLLNPPDNSSALVSTTCPTGNCTFPADAEASYSSLAMCHSCQDLTHTVSNYTSFIGNDSTGIYFNPNYSLPSGAQVVGIGSLLQSVSSQGYAADSLYSFDTLMLDTKGNPFAARCAIFPCLKTYGGNISRGILEETEVSSTPLVLGSGGQIASYNLVTKSKLRNGRWSNCNTSDHYSDDTPVAVTVNNTIWDQSTTGLQLTYYSEDCICWFDQGTSFGMWEFLDGTLYGHQNLSGPGGDYQAPIGNLWIENMYLNGTATLETMNTYMKGLTDSITATMRQRGDTPPSGYASGTTYGVQTCVGVAWPWLALPASLILLTCFFLLATILQTSALHGQQSWKSSALALLFHGLTEDTRQKLGSLQGVTEMEESAKAIEAKLDLADGAWRFIRTKN